MHTYVIYLHINGSLERLFAWTWPFGELGSVCDVWDMLLENLVEYLSTVGFCGRVSLESFANLDGLCLLWCLGSVVGRARCLLFLWWLICHLWSLGFLILVQVLPLICFTRFTCKMGFAPIKWTFTIYRLFFILDLCFSCSWSLGLLSVHRTAACHAQRVWICF